MSCSVPTIQAPIVAAIRAFCVCCTESSAESRHISCAHTADKLTSQMSISGRLRLQQLQLQTCFIRMEMGVELIDKMPLQAPRRP